MSKTKKYRTFFKKLLDDGDIPEDLYESVIAELDKEGKMTWRVYEYFISELERRRLFAVDGTPFNTENSAKTDGTYVYKRPKNPFWHIAHAIASGVFKFIGWFAPALVYGVWRIPDKKKLKKLGPCISVSNHIGYVDAVLTRGAFGAKKQYIIAAPHNCKNNFGGRLLRAATVIPLPATFRGAKPFNEMLEYVKSKGGSLHFYAEKSMWLRYDKPRPYLEGAFHYAVKLDVPVVVMLYCMQQPKGLRKLLGLPKAQVRIADPIYADKSLPLVERQKDLHRRAEQAARELYERFYGVPLEYLPETVPAARVEEAQTTEISE